MDSVSLYLHLFHSLSDSEEVWAGKYLRFLVLWFPNVDACCWWDDMTSMRCPRASLSGKGFPISSISPTAPVSYVWLSQLQSLRTL